MLDKNDIKLIGEEMGRVIEDNINPQFEEIRGRLDKLENQVANLPTKPYLDDKLADTISEIMKRIDKRWQREHDFNVRVKDILKRSNLANSEDIAYLEGLLASSAP